MNRSLQLSALAAAIAATPLAAHEYWIDADVGTQTDTPFASAHLRVGEDLSGSSLPYLDTTVRRMVHHAPTASGPIPARLGDRPAIGAIPLADIGLHILTVETEPAYVVFDMPDFVDYLAYEGLTGIAEAHRARDLPDVEIAEEFIRNARALIQVGPATEDDDDRPTGLPFEMTVIGSPFTANDALSVRLTWQGTPETDRQIALFHRPTDGTAPDATTRVLARTDADGVARFAPASPGEYMLNAVRIVPVDGPGSVVWQSYWASLTFDLPRSAQ